MNIRLGGMSVTVEEESFWRASGRGRMLSEDADKKESSWGSEDGVEALGAQDGRAGVEGTE